MKMNSRFFAAILCCLSCVARAAAQPPDAGAVSASTRPAAESPGADRDRLLAEKLSGLEDKIREEFKEAHASTSEEARIFRAKAMAIFVKYDETLDRASELPDLDAEEFDIHELIYDYPRIAARIFSAELEIYKSTSAYDYKAQAESLCGDTKQAEADWTAAIKMAPEPELLQHRGHLFMQQHKYGPAIEDFSRAIKTGGSASLYHSRALARKHKDDYAGAAGDLERFFELNTDKEYSSSVAHSPICSGLRRRGFEVEGCAAPESGGREK